MPFTIVKYLGPKKCESYHWLLASKCMRWHSRFTISVNFGGVSDGDSVHVPRVEPSVNSVYLNSWSPFFS